MEIHDESGNECEIIEDEDKDETVSITSEAENNALRPATYALNKLESHLLAIVLEDMMDQIEIIGARMPKYNSEFQYSVMKNRFAKRIKSIYFDPEINLPIDESGEKRRQIKLQKDRGQILKILGISLDEMKTAKTFNALISFNRLEKEKIFYEIDLEKESEQRKKLKLQYDKELQQQNKQNLELIEEQKSLINILMEQRDPDIYQRGTEAEYVKRWELTRFEQNDQKLKKEIFTMEKKLLEKRAFIEKEEHVHSAIMKFLEQSQQKMKSQIEYWSDRYVEDINDLDNKITNLNQRRTDENYMLEDMYNKYTTRDKFIKEYLAERAEREKKEEERLYFEKMATKIQAWWRGTMYRKQLGPHRPKKEKLKKKTKK